LANVVSTTPVRPPGTLCHLTYVTLLTLAYSRNDLKPFCLIVRTDLLLLLYGAPGRFVERCLTNLSLYLYLYHPRRGWPRRNFVKVFDADKTRMIGLPYGEKKLWQYVKPFSSDTGTLTRGKNLSNITRHRLESWILPVQFIAMFTYLI